MFKEMNINYYVKVKLNDIGKVELRRQHESLYKHSNIVSEYKEPDVDEDGYSKFQMWDLISTFGHMISMSSEPPFNTDILVEIK